MTSKDLMIGDWYAFRGHPYKCTASDIASIAECEEKGAPTDISEIPLTPEILEKNGFEKRYNYQWEYSDENCKIVISIAPQIEIDGEILGPPPINIEIEGALFDMSLTDYYCVHELQHVLRLCGIEKEIVL